MATPGSISEILVGAAASAGDYTISRSLRFNSADSAYLSRTPASAGNRRTYTFAFWIKRVNAPAAVSYVYGSYPTASIEYLIGFNSSQQFYIEDYPGSTALNVTSSAVFRDFSAWYHFVVAVDTTQGTAANRVKLYVNGSQITQLATATYPTQNFDTNVWNTGAASAISARGRTFTLPASHYLSDLHWIDGQALDPTSFGEFSATTGVWMPKAFTGSYGANGFKLDFSDNSAATATTLGKDSSGNGNNWTPNNLSVSTGGPFSVAAASGALPIYNTTDTYGTVKGTGTRTDANASSLVLAIPMNGTNGGTTFTDESAAIRGSGVAKTVTPSDNAQTSTAVSKYYGSSCVLDAVGSDALIIPAGTDFAYGTGNFTVEGWFYQTQSYSATGGSLLWSQTVSGSNYFTIWAGATSQNLTFIDNSGTITGASYNLNQWNHFAVVRSGTTVTLFVNGIAGGSGTRSNNYSDTSYNPTIGRYTHSNAQFFKGYLQDFRVYKGVAKYTSNFNPPSSTQNVTVAVGCDSLVDVPVNGIEPDTGAGGEVRGNYATLNPLTLITTNGSLKNGNLELDGVANDSDTISSATIAVNSGKWYWEVTALNSSGTISANQARGRVGIKPISDASTVSPGSSANSYSYLTSGQKINNSTFSNYGTAINTNNVVGVALDLDAGTLTYYLNNVSQGTAFSSLPSTLYIPSVAGAGNNSSVVMQWACNFGQRPFAYTAPSGFKALCTANLPAPTIVKPSTVMDVVTYTGTGSTLTPTSSLGFNPDLVWIKSRSAATDHALYDSVRGAQARLESNNTDAEVTSDSGVTAFNTAGFTLGTLAQVNTNAATYAAWTWDESVSAGFDIVSYTGTGSNRTISHSLGVAPAFLIIKQRTAASTTNWGVWHSALTGTEYLQLNSTAAKGSTPLYWNSTVPTSTVFSLAIANDVNASGGSYIAYLWAPVAGYSAFGSYTGNGSADGPFVYLGFRPRWVMVKASSAIGSWYIYDSKRDTYNVTTFGLFPNTNGNELSIPAMDLLSNGIKLKYEATYGANYNGSGVTYIYAAFAENPFSLARAR